MKVLMKRISRSKVDSVENVLRKIKPGMSIMMGGFGVCGIPGTLINELSKKKEINNLVVISNDGGTSSEGIGKLLKNKQISKMVSSYLGDNKYYQDGYLKGELELELVPQGNLAEKIRCGGSGIPFFATKTGLNTLVETGGFVHKFDSNHQPFIFSKPKRTVFDDKGQKYILETALRADVAFVKAFKADTKGNLVYNKTARNFNPDMAKAADFVIAEVEHIVEPGELNLEEIQTPAIYVNAIIKSDIKKNPIEKTANSFNMKMDQHLGEKEFQKKLKIAKKAASLISEGMYINLGIGIPTMVADFLYERDICNQSENGLLGLGGYPEPGQEDPDLINAGKMTVKMTKCASVFSSSESFSMIRGGHLDFTFLGAMEVSQNGDLANWIIPGKLVKGMGGAMDLVSSKTKVVCLTLHCGKHGISKIKKNCTLPLTGKKCVSQIITEFAVFDVDHEKGLILSQISDDITIEELKRITEAEFTVNNNLIQY